jgi:murein L,D-transpeptidase YcbB/YkuD
VVAGASPRFALLLVVLMPWAQALAASAEPTIRQLLGPTAAPALPGGPDRLFDAAAVRSFYLQRDFRPAWTGPDCQAALTALVEAIAGVDSHGLTARDYHLDSLLGPDRCQASRDLLATDAWLALAAHLHAGRVDPLTVEPDWTAIRPRIDAVALLQQALADGDVGAALERLAPAAPLYAQLRAALARYRGYQGRGGWVGVDTGPALRLGDGGIRVDQLRARLALAGLLAPDPAAEGAPFDLALDAAVRAFQRRSNLEPDGIVGALTLDQLNRRARDRIDQLRANLERVRWLPADSGARHLRVNIADFRLEAWAGGRIERVHRVIVGQQYRRTPSFSGTLTHLVFSPWWEVPHSLAVRDKLPQFRRDPGAVERLGYQVLDRAGEPVDPAGIDWSALSARQFPYRLRQRPGPLNALGQVKFMFPNRHSVYLHDTPSRSLFEHVRRDFSSGCIRVESALELAHWLLQPLPGWSPERIDAVATASVETTVRLDPPVAVHLLYQTAVDDGAGGIRLIDDIYRRDPELVAALDRAPPTRGDRR